MSPIQKQEGFALSVVIFALAVLAVLSTAGFFIARQETRIAVATKRATHAFYVAETGAMEVLSEWDADRFSRMATWSSATVTDRLGDGVWSVDVTRLSHRLYFLLANGKSTAGEAGYGGAGRALGFVAKVESALIDPQAALTTVGDLTVGGSSQIDGTDISPAAWTGYCDPTKPAKPGVLVDSLSNISIEGRKASAEGSPPFAEDNTLTSDSLLTFGDQEWEDLVALATLTLHDGSVITQTYPDSTLVDGSYVCGTSNPLNWGDPFNPGGACGRYFPVIYAAGDLTIQAHDSGQGILLVEGNLTFKGGFEFFGPVIVRESVLTEGTGGHFNGGLIAANVDLSASTVLGDALVQYSSCSVERAILNSALSQVRPLERRSFVDASSLFGG